MAVVEIMDTRSCNKCQEVLTLNEFYQKPKTICKKCVKILKKHYYSSYRITILAKKKEYAIENTDKIKEQCHKYYETVKNLDSYKVKRRSAARKYRKNRYSQDLQYKLSQNLRIRVSHAIRDNLKSGSAVSDLGCSIEELKKHLESKFKPGMSWDNWGWGSGTWQIDHIDSLCKFDLTDREQFLKACSYINLQPLWYEDHLIKTVDDIKVTK